MGIISNEITGEAIEDVMLQLVDDANITPVVTNADGTYSLTAHEGTYKLKATKRGYHSKEVTLQLTITGDSDIDVSLSPIFTYPGDEIGYDNGEIDNGSMYYRQRCGMGSENVLCLTTKTTAFVTEGLFHFLDKGFSDTIGTEFNVEVWDAKGPDGLPGEKLAGPLAAEAVLDGWTSVDLSDHEIQVDGDFYMVYVQTLEYPSRCGSGN